MTTAHIDRSGFDLICSTELDCQHSLPIFYSLDDFIQELTSIVNPKYINCDAIVVKFRRANVGSISRFIFFKNKSFCDLIWNIFHKVESDEKIESINVYLKNGDLYIETIDYDKEVKFFQVRLLTDFGKSYLKNNKPSVGKNAHKKNKRFIETLFFNNRYTMSLALV